MGADREREDRLVELAGQLLKALQPAADVLEGSAVAFMLLVREVEASGLTPMELTLADVKLMAGKAAVRLGRMEARLRERAEDSKARR